jgi:hypothetical protein
MFTIPSLRAKDCAPREKEALNLLFLLVRAAARALRARCARMRACVHVECCAQHNCGAWRNTHTH